MGLCLLIQHLNYTEIPVKNVTTHNAGTMVCPKSDTTSRLCIAPVREIFKEKAKAHRKTLSSHPNSLMRPLTTQPQTRRLRRKWTFDGIK